MINPWLLFAIACFVLAVQAVEWRSEHRTYNRVKKWTKPLTLVATATVASVSLYNGIVSYQRSLPRNINQGRDVAALKRYANTRVNIQCNARRPATNDYFHKLGLMLEEAGWTGSASSCGSLATGVQPDDLIEYDFVGTDAAAALAEALKHDGENVELRSIDKELPGVFLPPGGPNSISKSSDVRVTVYDR
jgi:hypothetical protein